MHKHLEIAPEDYRKIRDGTPLRYGVEFLYEDASRNEYAFCEIGRYVWDKHTMAPLTTRAEPCPAKLPTEDPQ
jgi:hypothetical protein